jgi:hypothetical protein
LNLGCAANRKDAAFCVCPNPFLFYKIISLLPSFDRRKQVPSDSLLKSDYENP